MVVEIAAIAGGECVVGNGGCGGSAEWTRNYTGDVVSLGRGGCDPGNHRR